MVEPRTTSDALTAIRERVQWRATAIEIQPLCSVCAAFSVRCCPPHHCGSLPCGCERWQQPWPTRRRHTTRSRTPTAAARRATRNGAARWRRAAVPSTPLRVSAPVVGERWHPKAGSCAARFSNHGALLHHVAPSARAMVRQRWAMPTRQLKRNVSSPSHGSEAVAIGHRGSRRREEKSAGAV